MEKTKNNSLKILAIIAAIVVILVIAYAVYHYSGMMEMFNSHIAHNTGELIR